MTRDEISEYPYQGTITRIIEGHGDEDDTEVTLYSGVMDEHMVTDDEGRVLQTSSYIISIQLTKDDNNNYIIPRSGDNIYLVRYGESLRFVVENAEPSQIGGVSIYVTRKSWD
jgi:hypothetical protein